MLSSCALSSYCHLHLSILTYTRTYKVYICINMESIYFTFLFFLKVLHRESAAGIGSRAYPCLAPWYSMLLLKRI